MTKIKILSTWIFSIFSSLSYAEDFNMKITAKIDAGCIMSANDVHFNLEKGHSTSKSKWSNLNIKTFDAVEFLYLRVQCSKGTKFGVQNASSNYPNKQIGFKLSHTTDLNAPSITYWLNNYSPNSSELSNMLSPNMKRNVSVNLYTRLRNGVDFLSYTVTDDKEGWVKFAVQLEAQSYYNFIPGDYADTVILQITY